MVMDRERRRFLELLIGCLGTFVAIPKGVARVTTYRVQKGDTLSGISRRFGLSVNELKAANRINGDLIRVGQSLRIPAPFSVAQAAKAAVSASNTSPSAAATLSASR